MEKTIRLQTNPLLPWRLSFFFVTSFLTTVTAVEETQPEIFLSPRHFNPHPYEAGYDPRDGVDANRVGPVVFPPSPPDEDNNDVLTLARERQLNHPIDDHPYPKVARKRKYQFPGRFSQQQNTHINPKVYEALSNHAAKVLSEPASQLRKDYTLSSLSNQHRNYAFSYKVLDHLTGDDYSHTQSQNSRTTNGEYRVKLPDGRVQIVSYTADKNGYKADVKYTENDISTQNLQIRRIPDPASIQIPILRANYQSNVPYASSPTSPTRVFQDYNTYITATPSRAPSPTPPTGVFQDYNTYITATPSPIYPKSNIHFTSHHASPKVQIYPNGLGNYISSTVAPYLLQDSKGYRQDIVASTISPTLAGYTQVYNAY